VFSGASIHAAEDTMGFYIAVQSPWSEPGAPARFAGSRHSASVGVRNGLARHHPIAPLLSSLAPTEVACAHDRFDRGYVTAGNMSHSVETLVHGTLDAAVRGLSDEHFERHGEPPQPKPLPLARQQGEVGGRRKPGYVDLI
jgi:hypothetical protein